jgi:hypothetical protein
MVLVTVTVAEVLEVVEEALITVQLGMDHMEATILASTLLLFRVSP